LAATLIGGAAASGGAASLNHYFDRDIDERMRRTRRRPLPAHRISTGVTIWWGIALNVVAFIVLAVFTNLLAAALALGGTVLYLAAAIVLGALFIGYAFRLLRGGAVRRRAMARAVYLYSLLYLALLFVAIMVDSTLRL